LGIAILILSLASPAVSGVAGEPPAGKPDNAVAVPEAGAGMVEDPLPEDEDDEGADSDRGEDSESEMAGEVGGGTTTIGRPVYTMDIPDEELARRWKENPESLGSLSMGYTDSGRLLFGERFPDGDQWVLMSPENAWATRETIEYVKTAIEEVNRLYPGSPPLSVGDFSRKNGGWFRPHKSHQTGRDADLGFYYTAAPAGRFEAGSKRNMDLPRNWALLRTLMVGADVQVILVDRRVQKVLYEYAVSIGEDREWLDSVFKAGWNSVVKHARRHRGHYHIRFFNPRAQELARRVHPYIDKGKDETKFAVHRIRSGDCLGKLAVRYNTTITAIKRANGLRGNSIRAGRTLTIPLLGPCSRCPLPPEVLVPQRRVPPTTPDAMMASGGSTEPPRSKVRPSIEKYFGAGGLFPPHRTFAIPLAY
jgi:LysM repeat protein/murein endopeptidase